MLDLRAVADAADMIINGYAFTQNGAQVRVLNLQNPARAAVIMNDEIMETTMDDIEASIVRGYYANNKQFMSK